MAATGTGLPRLGLTWVTWRQHRAAVFGLLGLLAVYAAALLIHGLHTHANFDRLGLNQCRSFATGRCEQLSHTFLDDNYHLLQVVMMFLLVLPAAFGAFLGGPLVARELETGTYRFAWTQGVSRTRWAATKIALIGAALAAVTAAYGPLYMWWAGPQRQIMTPSFNDYLGFEFSGFLFPVHTLLAFALGVLAGLVLRRTIPAIAVSFGTAFGLLLAAVFVLRRFYMTPLATTAPVGSRDWVVGTTYLDPSGHALPDGGHALFLRFVAQLPDPTSDVPSGAFRQWLEARHYKILYHYQPGGRLWDFQLIETAWMGGLALACLAVALWLLRQRTD